MNSKLVFQVESRQSFLEFQMTLSSSILTLAFLVSQLVNYYSFLSQLYKNKKIRPAKVYQQVLK